MSGSAAGGRIAAPQAVLVTGGDVLHRSEGGGRGKQGWGQGWGQDGTAPVRGGERRRGGYDKSG